MNSPDWKALVAVVTVLTSGVPTLVNAACSTAAERAAFVGAATATLGCATRILRVGGDAGCGVATPPACAAVELATLVELTGGLPEAASASSESRLCQRSIYRATRRFLRRRIREQERGTRRQVRSWRATRLRSRCDVAAGAAEPSLGGACASIVPAAGELVDGRAVGDCLRAGLEGVVNSLTGRPTLQPNVVVIVTDDQRWDTFDVTPEIDALAERGVRFENAFAATPLCGPSRGTILTGQHPTTSGIVSNFAAPVMQDIPTVATWLQDGGYRTGLYGKYNNFYDWVSPAIPPGWDDWQAFVGSAGSGFDYELNENGQIVSYGDRVQDYSTDVLRQRVLDFIRDNGDAPFFAYFAPFAPHNPSTPAPRHVGSLATLSPWRPPNWGHSFMVEKPSWLRFWETDPATLASHDPDRIEQLESLLAIDEAVGDIVELLERRGLSDNTVVLFLSDHGLHWGEHWWRGKRTAYEESIRIPFVMRYPMLRATPVVEPGMVVTTDVATTVAALAGVTPAIPQDGRNLAELLGGQAWRSDVLLEHHEDSFAAPPWSSVRNDQHKYVRTFGTVPFEELYDLASDPYELDNLVGDPGAAATLVAMSARLDELLGTP